MTTVKYPTMVTVLDCGNVNKIQAYKEYDNT